MQNYQQVRNRKKGILMAPFPDRSSHILNRLIKEFEGYISRIGISPINTSINEKLNDEH